MDPITAKGLAQPHGDRFLIQNPPAPYATQAEMDAVYALPFQRRQHPYYEQMGPVKAAGDDRILDQHPSRLLWRM